MTQQPASPISAYRQRMRQKMAEMQERLMKTAMRKLEGGQVSQRFQINLYAPDKSVIVTMGGLSSGDVQLLNIALMQVKAAVLPGSVLVVSDEVEPPPEAPPPARGA